MASQVTTGRFVGRTNELARLRQLLARAADGQPLVAVIGGEAGVGKTRLAEELAATANEQGVRVLRGGCVPLGRRACRSRRSPRRYAAWPTSWTLTSWRQSPAPPAPSWTGCCPTWPGVAQPPPAPRPRVLAKPARGSCSSCCWGWSSGWPPARRCCG